jgi:hypothetical protein
LNVNTTSSTLHYVNDAINLSNDPTAHWKYACRISALWCRYAWNYICHLFI